MAPRAAKRSTPPKEDNSSNDAVLKELEAMRRLMVLLLAKLGADSNEIAMALDVAPTTVRNWLPMRKVVRLALPGGEAQD
jgi:DNA-directed RNA polymerase specialized sigma24 family protein